MDIQIKAVVVDAGRCPDTSRSKSCIASLTGIQPTSCRNILNATGGGKIFAELTRNSIEEAYAQITSEARNQYTLGYTPKAIASGSAYRTSKSLVDQEGAEDLREGGILLDSWRRPIKLQVEHSPCPRGHLSNLRAVLSI